MSTYDLFYVNIWLLLSQDLTYLTSTCVFVNMWLHSLMATCFLTYANTSTWVLCQLVTCLVNIWHVIYRHVTCFISNMWLVLFQTWLALCQHVTCLMSFCDLSDLNMWLFYVCVRFQEEDFDSFNKFDNNCYSNFLCRKSVTKQQKSKRWHMDTEILNNDK